jgi:hypothetical protein
MGHNHEARRATTSCSDACSVPLSAEHFVDASPPGASYQRPSTTRGVLPRRPRPARGRRLGGPRRVLRRVPGAPRHRVSPGVHDRRRSRSPRQIPTGMSSGPSPSWIPTASVSCSFPQRGRDIPRAAHQRRPRSSAHASRATRCSRQGRLAILLVVSMKKGWLSNRVQAALVALISVPVGVVPERVHGRFEHRPAQVLRALLGQRTAAIAVTGLVDARA